MRALAFAGFFWVLVVLTAIDLEHKLLPDRVVFPALVVGASLLVVDALVTGDALAAGPPTIVATLMCLTIIVLYFRMPWQKQDADEAPDESESPRQVLIELGVGVLLLVGWIYLFLAGSVNPERGSIATAVEGAAFLPAILASTGLIYSALRGRSGMGGGDIKLGLILGFFVGSIGGIGLVFLAMFLSAFTGAVIGAVYNQVKKKRGETIPFGPFLALGSTIAIFAGRPILDAYLGAL